MSASAEAAGAAAGTAGDGDAGGDTLPRLAVVEADGVAVWTLQRPAKRNALDRAMVAALHDACAAVEVAIAADGDAAPRVVILTGAGDVFAAGADIAELRDRRAADALQAINASVFDRIARLPLPTIAAVRGLALGGGCELAMACDLRVVGRSARLGQPEVGLGIVAAAGGTYRLPALVGLGRARELLFSGRIVCADEALQIGLCERVVEDEAVIDDARAWARQIARQDPLALRLTKQALAAWTPQEVACQRQATLAQATAFESPAKFARMDAFLARRQGKA